MHTLDHLLIRKEHMWSLYGYSCHRQWHCVRRSVTGVGLCWSRRLCRLQIGKGLLRVILGNSLGVADVIPVDLAINMMIAAAWHTATER